MVCVKWFCFGASFEASSQVVGATSNFTNYFLWMVYITFPDSFHIVPAAYNDSLQLQTRSESQSTDNSEAFGKVAIVPR